MASSYPTSLERFSRLRQSLLAAFDRCALTASFDLEYRKDWSGHPQARGQITHRVLAECLRTMFKRSERTIPTDAALEILHEALLQNGVDDRCGRCGAPATVIPGEQRIRCENGHTHGSNFVNIPMDQVKDLRWVVIKFATDNAFDIQNLVDIEQRLMSSLRYPDVDGGWTERTLSGQLDALFVVGEAADHAIVLDWKDTWALPAATEVGFDGYFQQRFYAWLVLKNYPTVQRVTLREFYVRFSEAREADVWRADIDDVEAELAALAKRFDQAFEQQNFPPSPGKHCQMCPLPERCPIFPGVRTEGQIQSPEQAEKYAKEATVAKDALRNRDREMKAWASVRGDIPISDHKGPRVWGYRERTRTSRPTRDQMEAALAAGAVDLDSLYSEAKQTRFEEHSEPVFDEHPSDEELEATLRKSIEQEKDRESAKAR